MKHPDVTSWSREREQQRGQLQVSLCWLVEEENCSCNLRSETEAATISSTSWRHPRVRCAEIRLREAEADLCHSLTSTIYRSLSGIFIIVFHSCTERVIRVPVKTHLKNCCSSHQLAKMVLSHLLTPHWQWQKEEKCLHVGIKMSPEEFRAFVYQLILLQSCHRGPTAHGAFSRQMMVQRNTLTSIKRLQESKLESPNQAAILFCKIPSPIWINFPAFMLIWINIFCFCQAKNM